MFKDFKLEVFRTAATELNFSKAARKLNITQPAVSMHIMELENMMGDKLFTRIGNSMHLTAKGKVLLDYTDRILHLYDMLNRELLPHPQAVPQKLVLYAEPLAAKYILPEIIQHFRKAYPQIEITLLERSREEISAGLKEGTVDLGIAEGKFGDSLKLSPLARIEIGNSTRAYRELNFIYQKKSEKLELIKLFILSRDALI